MEVYTDINNPEYIPGTYSIYTSAIIQQRHNQTIQKKRRKNNINIKNSNFEDQRYLSINRNYKYDSKKPLNSIPLLKTRYGVILLPQPTNSINDPKNWSILRKSIHFLILMLITSFTAAVSNDASAPQDSINELTNISYDALNNSAGLLFISIALSSWLYGPLYSLCGCRITYILGIFFSLIGSIIYGKIKTTGFVFGSQILIGFAQGSTEAQIQLSLSSIFYRHQFGSVITIYILSFSMGTYIGPLLANYISSSKDFRWVGWSGAISSGIILVIVLLFLEEDKFKTTTTTHNNNDNHLIDVKSNESLGYSDEKWTIRKRLTILKIQDLNSNFIKQYFKLLKFNLNCFWFPPVLFSGLIWGLQDAILTFYLTTEDTELYDPPFNYGDDKVALMNIPCLIGSIIGCIYAGSLTDYFILWMARKNNGIVESEYRLYFAFLSGIIGSVGLLMFAIGISKNLNWRVYYIGLGLIGYLFSSAGNIAMLYIIDTYDQLILECLIAVSVINNLIGCIFTFACSPWLNKSGTQNTYIVLAVLNLFIMFLAAPYIKWGKTWRKWTKNYYLQMIKVREGD
ncbi:hypothetical protein CANARDRAFT_8286 [[Candida] arabinofermentans NRRL YB-2248]|uniref:Major facilitator superfamily (MFS) profile domain-containing protein n=1 Tax=[Candida] arabinofermentans NRRL YB-2248 TaxID=983967 RepID=A0A1E4SYZ5_9ASCO|nr:hypothetical protein CANARDRAFT_8286 [[Candida] arabinofermentans NRRL YB-2248]